MNIADLPLNKDQRHAADMFFKFLMNSSQKEMAISGPAGTGKTYLLQHLLAHILPEYREACKLVDLDPIISNVALTATTNRAADVLSGQMNLKAQTVHSFMNLKVYDDYSTGQQKLKKTDRFIVHNRTLIIIDEAGMVDRQLYKVLHEGTSSNCKIVYVGDHYQLPPVGEEQSLVFRDDIPRAELLTPVRNANQPALMDLCDQLRETVRTGIFKPIRAVPGVIEHLSDADMQHHVNTVFSQEGADSRILAYTNDQVRAYNDYIRRNRGHTARFGNGEKVINNTSIQLPGKINLPAEREYTLRVSDEPKQVDIPLDETNNLSCYEVILKEDVTGALISCLQPDNQVYFRQVLKHYAKQKMWPSYFDLKNRIPDLRPRDSSTVYKAQGSTYGSVYVDLENIGKVTVGNTAARMLYVALSRPRTQVFTYGRLPPRYLGM